MEKFVDFMSGKKGQLLRIVVGVLLVLSVLILTNTAAQWIVVVLGVAFVLSGVFKVCIFNKLVGRPFSARPKED